MKSPRILTMALALLVLGWTALPAKDEAATKPQLKLPKKRAVTYTITREDKSSSSRGGSTSTSEVTYKISRGDAEDTINVEYVALKAKNDSERFGYEFDSSKETGGGDIAAAVRKAIAKPLSVTLSGGAIKEIKGFPGSGDSGDDGDREARRRRFRMASIAGERTLRRDLELVLASAVQGQTLEAGKSYRVKRAAPEDGGGRRRGFRGSRSDVVFKFEGRKKNRATFALSTARRERPDGDGDRPRFERKETSEGKAIVTLGNGLLASLTLATKSDISGEFQGNEFKMTRESKVSVKRQNPNRKAGQGKKKGNKGNKGNKGKKGKKGKKGEKAENAKRDA